MRTIVLTRPLPCSNELQTQLRQAGLRVYHLPTLSLSAFQDDGAEARIRKHWPNYTVAMFVSQHAAALGTHKPVGALKGGVMKEAGH